MNIGQRILILLIRGYQAVISPALAVFFGPAGRCRYTPSCSQYAREAIGRHGVVAGGVLAATRLCRCHPWGASGDDPVPAPNLNPNPNLNPVARGLRLRLGLRGNLKHTGHGP
jgi:putative membrane protein insertion efficiency factor